MGYRSWNAYDEDLERDRRERLAALPWHIRLYLKARAALIIMLIIIALAAFAFRGSLSVWLPSLP